MPELDNGGQARDVNGESESSTSGGATAVSVGVPAILDDGGRRCRRHIVGGSEEADEAGECGGAENEACGGRERGDWLS